MDYLNDVFPTILDLECVSCAAADGGSESSRISSKISSFGGSRDPSTAMQA